VFKRLREDVGCVLQRDPAATSATAVLLTYPGLHALLAYRLGNWLWRRRLHTLAELTAYAARIVTGIEIHPGATIGRRVFIDHGSGVVVGSTAEIGDDVTLYQGVTLGGTSLEPGKRHPTLGTGVVVGANATVLGPITVGDHARVGANAVVLRDVPEYCTAVGVPARIVRPEHAEELPEFLPYGTPLEDLPDPLGKALRGLVLEVSALRRRVGELEDDLTRRGSVGELSASSGSGGRPESAAAGEEQPRHRC